MGGAENGIGRPHGALGARSKMMRTELEPGIIHVYISILYLISTSPTLLLSSEILLPLLHLFVEPLIAMDTSKTSKDPSPDNSERGSVMDSDEQQLVMAEVPGRRLMRARGML